MRVVEGFNWSPRAGAAFSVLPEGRGILRGGFGKFVQRTPLNVDAFTSFEPRTVTRFATDGVVLAGPVTFAHRVDGPLETPEAYVGNLEWDQRFGRRVLLKVAGLGPPAARTSTSSRPTRPSANCGFRAAVSRATASSSPPFATWAARAAT